MLFASTVVAYMLITFWQGEYKHEFVPGDLHTCDRVGDMIAMMAKEEEPDKKRLQFYCLPVELTNGG